MFIALVAGLIIVMGGSIFYLRRRLYQRLPEQTLPLRLVLV
jgi:hypothetical protein